MTKYQTWKTKWKNEVLSLLSRGNQDGISKSYTALQLTGIIIDKNSKKHPQNKLNQKDLSQLMKYFSSSFKLKQKVVENQKPKCVKAEII